MATVLVCIVAAGMIAGILFRPRNWPEAVWSTLGAVVLVLFRLLPPSKALSAILKGTDVYLFLTGMMLLAELARRQGVFDWMAGFAVRAASGSPGRLFALVYLVGTIVTVFLSNDATAVVLTPAVYAAIKKARAEPLPYLFICAFIANAASFVLPISNPANLVVYGNNLPPLVPWLRLFILPSLVSIAVTFAVLRFLSRRELDGTLEQDAEVQTLSGSGRRAAWGIALTGLTLIGASGLGLDLGLPTCVAAIVAVLVATGGERRALAAIVKNVSWSVLPLVAGLFVLVEALDGAGALVGARSLINRLATLPPLGGALAASFGVAALSNLMNNLPSGLLTGVALQMVQVPTYLRHAFLIGVDLGPNLSVTGSLATVLWLIALRREGERVSGWTFLKTGALVMPPALFLATLALVLTVR
jgi:arsenical pump membrane protein